MARIRSPNYPALSLPEAIEKVALVYKNEQHVAAPREVIAHHMGYAGINGSSLKAISALLKYGLLEKTKDDKRKVTPLAVKILHPSNEAEKMAALREAAGWPALFVDFAKEWPDGHPSDANLKSYLLHRGFSMDAIPEVIKAYRGTIKLVTPSEEEYKEAEGSSRKGPLKEPPAMQPPMRVPLSPSPRMPPPTREEDAYKVTFTGSGIEIVGRIVSEADADNLIKAVTALKILLQSPTKVNYPENYEEPQDEE